MMEVEPAVNMQEQQAQPPDVNGSECSPPDISNKTVCKDVEVAKAAVVTNDKENQVHGNTSESHAGSEQGEEQGENQLPVENGTSPTVSSDDQLNGQNSLTEEVITCNDTKPVAATKPKKKSPTPAKKARKRKIDTEVEEKPTVKRGKNVKAQSQGEPNNDTLTKSVKKGGKKNSEVENGILHTEKVSPKKRTKAAKNKKPVDADADDSTVKVQSAEENIVAKATKSVPKAKAAKQAKEKCTAKKTKQKAVPEVKESTPKKPRKRPQKNTPKKGTPPTESANEISESSEAKTANSSGEAISGSTTRSQKDLEIQHDSDPTAANKSQVMDSNNSSTGDTSVPLTAPSSDTHNAPDGAISQNEASVTTAGGDSSSTMNSSVPKKKKVPTATLR